MICAKPMALCSGQGNQAKTTLIRLSKQKHEIVKRTFLLRVIHFNYQDLVCLQLALHVFALLRFQVAYVVIVLENINVSVVFGEI